MDRILSQVAGCIATITINRPHVLNALDGQSIFALTQALLEAEAHPEVRCVILNASGEKAFCVGGDIKEEVQMDGQSSYDFSRLGQGLMNTIRGLSVPVIVAMQGYSLGAGMEILLAADFVFLSTDAKIAIPSINLGSMPGFGGTQMLPRAVGSMRAKDILMTGRHVTAQEALALGLCLKVVEREALMPEAQTLAEALVKKAPLAIRSIKAAVNKAGECDLDTGFLLETQLFSRVQASEDKKAGMEAFLEKREAPQYHNR